MTSRKKTYYPGETFSKTVDFKDKDDALFDPDNITVTSYDPDNTKIDDTITLTKNDTGEYELNYNIPSDAAEGVWKILIKATKGTFVDYENVRFRVEDV